MLFHYESLRANYLNRWAGRDLPKLKLLFPPAGWIMFYRVDVHSGSAEVYGLRAAPAEPELIDPHRIFATRWLGYDNIRRNILITALDSRRGPAFCAYLARKFPEYQSFVVAQVVVPEVTAKPQRVYRQGVYRCR